MSFLSSQLQALYGTPENDSFFTRVPFVVREALGPSYKLPKQMPTTPLEHKKFVQTIANKLGENSEANEAWTQFRQGKKTAEIVAIFEDSIRRETEVPAQRFSEPTSEWFGGGTDAPHESGFSLAEIEAASQAAHAEFLSIQQQHRQ